MTKPDDLAASEGDDFPDDVPPVFSERPIRVVMIAGECSVDDEDLLDLRAPDLRTLAQLMFEAGFDASRELILVGVDRRLMGRTSVAAAAGVGGHES